MYEFTMSTKIRMIRHFVTYFRNVRTVLIEDDDVVEVHNDA